MSGRPENRWRDRLRRGTGVPLVIAHRGDSSHAPENTLEAARLGRLAGADAWELDVQLTRDGVPVVLHDPTLRRTTDASHRYADDPRAASLRVADFDTAEIQVLDAGSWFLDPSGTGRTAAGFGTLGALDPAAVARLGSGSVRVPTLAEALGLTAELDWLVNVEIKADGPDIPALLRATLVVVAASGLADRVLISSFDHEVVGRVARERPELATGVLTAGPIRGAAEYVRHVVGADFHHASVAGAEAAWTELEATVRAGVPVLVYTVNDAAPGGLAERLATAGVAGLFTDDPAAAASRWRD